ncbi:hypothetical protein [Paenibacillus thermotolerans]|uniref:hypothetical protein n=1 Tax=Paenibacillus thermotolerans TaxID=3027807 RepID=UPI00236844D1|nr:MULTISPECIES: hypothetical protein [unclassified Paenibacillus]
MKQKLTNLIETRKLSALAIIGLFIYMAIDDKLETNFVQTVIISIITFYFGQSTARDNPKKSD